jgi:hypothetical protein
MLAATDGATFQMQQRVSLQQFFTAAFYDMLLAARPHAATVV